MLNKIGKSTSISVTQFLELVKVFLENVRPEHNNKYRELETVYQKVSEKDSYDYSSIQALVDCIVEIQAYE